MNNPTFKALSVLLQYPSPELLAQAGELESIVLAENHFTPDTKERLVAFIQHLKQEQYVGLFDRSRALSLHLFEHVHGESRDRGQAMVDLKDHYQAHGFVMDSNNELPDYLPLLLEFLAYIPKEESRDMLRELLAILIGIFSRLRALDSQYASIFAALIALTEIEVNDIPTVDPKSIFINEEELDEQWEEQAVNFGGGSCGVQRQGERVH